MRHRRFYFDDASGSARLLGQIWEPEDTPRALLQIVHGINEYGSRYGDLAAFLAGQGIVVAVHDLMGHGGSVAEGAPHGYFAPQDGWRSCLADLRNFNGQLRREYPGLPIFLMGHSLGSFMVRDTLIRYDDKFDGVILSGTGCNSRLRYDSGLAISSLIRLFKGPRAKSRLARDLCFARYARPYKREHPSIAWLTRDRQEYLAYAKDPWCRFMPSVELIRQMLGSMRHMDSPRNYRQIRRDIPLLLISGDGDPAGNFGKGVALVCQRLQAAGCADVTLRLYPGARHEVVSDPDKAQVYADILAWLEEKLLKAAGC